MTAPNGQAGRKVDARELSDTTCAVRLPGSDHACGRAIKRNVAMRKKVRPLACYRCHSAGERTRSAR